MSAVRYSFRPYRPGDEDAINELYFRITGRRRTREQWRWQWQEAPGGHGDIWLIEAARPNGRVELIGHHGIMPVRFTWGVKDLLFGKTENTMVLPEYRRKILYPRYERRFAAEYESRYHALFSTMGPAAAIRQRRAMGYEATNRWVRMQSVRGVRGLSVLVSARLSSGTRHVVSRYVARPQTNAALPEGVQVLSREEARDEPFFDAYWRRARKNWGVAPRRSRDDLTWRFWDNPNVTYHAVIVRHPQLGEAAAVVEGYNNGTAKIADFSTGSPRPELLDYALDAVLRAVTRRFGARVVTCLLTQDALPQNCMQALQSEFRLPWIARTLKRGRPEGSRCMPRKVTERGKALGLSMEPWNATSILTEGIR